ncbi:hypothetical protein ACVXZY_09590 [Staphylococcus aureus]
MPLWLLYGATIRREIERYIVDKEVSMGYDHVLYTSMLMLIYTKHLVTGITIKKICSHQCSYETESMVLRPMNCPHHMMIYANKPHSLANYLSVSLS